MRLRVPAPPATRWTGSLKAAVRAIDEDNCLGLAPQLAFYFLLSLFPALPFLVALIVTNFSDYNATYGAIGGVIVVLLWLYVSGLAILIGAELNSVLARSGGPSVYIS